MAGQCRLAVCSCVLVIAAVCHCCCKMLLCRSGNTCSHKIHPLHCAVVLSIYSLPFAQSALSVSVVSAPSVHFALC